MPPVGARSRYVFGSPEHLCMHPAYAGARAPASASPSGRRSYWSASSGTRRSTSSWPASPATSGPSRSGRGAPRRLTGRATPSLAPGRASSRDVRRLLRHRRRTPGAPGTVAYLDDRTPYFTLHLDYLRLRGAPWDARDGGGRRRRRPPGVRRRQVAPAGRGRRPRGSPGAGPAVGRRPADTRPRPARGCHGPVDGRRAGRRGRRLRNRPPPRRGRRAEPRPRAGCRVVFDGWSTAGGGVP